MTDENRKNRLRKPDWLRRKLPSGEAFERVRALIKNGALHTVCQEAKCPNQWECFSHQTATFLIMGPNCTRNCRFCAVNHGPLTPPDPEEPRRVAEAAADLGLSYVVVTSVTRDDLPDGGASIFAETIKAIRRRLPGALIEVLIPDFLGDPRAVRKVVEARPNVLNHNIETVPRLYPVVRPGALYERSLDIFRRAKSLDMSLPLKSGLMLGLGESAEEIRESLRDIKEAGCDLLTLGQYLQPSPLHLPIERFIPPDEFERWRWIALEMGFSKVASAPFVRSSYHARDLLNISDEEARPL